jgi:hypothetical protein
MEARFAHSNESTAAQRVEDVLGEPAPSSVLPPDDVAVVFTDARGTRAALAQADELARGLGAGITLIAAEVVPFPAQLSEPPVASSFAERFLKDLASECESPVRVQLYLCRDSEPVLRQVLRPGARVVVGAPSSWWHWRESHVVRLLRHLGHPVLEVISPAREQKRRALLTLPMSLAPWRTRLDRGQRT